MPNPLRWSPPVKALVVVLGGMVASLWVTGYRSLQDARRDTCLGTVKMMSLALLTYAADWDNCLPQARDFVAVEKRTMGTHSLRRCPNDHSHQECSYAMALGVSGALAGTAPGAARRMMIYEADLGVPAYRHRGGITVGYADGGVKCLEGYHLTRSDIGQGADLGLPR
jgi:prepilin-type processing-associated H-X9-DG protein